MFSLSLKSLIFYKKQYFWTFVGLVTAAAILSGALSVGSSVKFSLQKMAEKRLGKTSILLDARFSPVSDRLANELTEEFSGAPLLMMMGSAYLDDTQVSGVFINGIDERFKQFFPDAPEELEEDAAWLSFNLAQKLKINDGEEFVLRVRNHSLLPGDLPLTGSSDEHVALRFKARIFSAESNAGRFSLMAAQIPPYNVFVNLTKLQKDVNMKGLVNEVLFKETNLEQLQLALNQKWLPSDSSMTLRLADNETAHELISTRVFLPEEIVRSSETSKILTYMANEISFDGKSVPYSIVTGLSFDVKAGQIYEHLKPIKAGEVILNKWTADDLGAKIGDDIRIKYYVDNDEGKLREDTAKFKVISIVEPEKLDRLLMPSFPGIADEAHCRDWEPGIPMDMEKIRDKDEDYWEDFKGTPKLMISYQDAVNFWGNRFGQTTSIRWPVSTPKDNILEELRKEGASRSGLHLVDIKGQASRAASQGIDFGVLFTSMSFFIIVAALLMSALLLAFQLENRKPEMGIMLATGFTGKDVKKRFFKEGLLLAFLALISGLLLGVLYTDQVIKLLSTVWLDAVGTTEINMYIDGFVLFAASVTYLVFAAVTLHFVIKRFTRRTTSSLLNNATLEAPYHKPSLKLFYSGIVMLVVAIVAVVLGTDSSFAIASSLLLLSALFITHGAFQKLRHGNKSIWLIPFYFVLRNSARQSGRSLGAFILMACGAYLVLNTVARQKSFNLDSSEKVSGTGGFEYFLKTSVPLRYKPDSPEGIDEYALEKEEINKLSLVSMRLHSGDDASCLNLNRAQNPQIYGISSHEMAGRFFMKGNWEDLDKVQEDGTIPAIGDENTVLWGLGLYTGIGSIFETRDEQGRVVKLKIVGLLKSSTLQGALIVSRGNFDRLYPAESGYSVFLLDTPEEYDVEEYFTSYFSDFGLEKEDSVERLKNFLKIEGTYLVIFQMLGGLGLILGACGFGFIILRNVQDRSGEIATMQAIGFTKKDLHDLILKEHVLLLLWSVFCGAFCAIISWIPLLKQDADLPISRILTILMLILITGVVSCFISAGSVLKSNFLTVLRNE